MRQMAFSRTTPQVLDRSKTVTRRAGYSWMALRPGQLVQAVERAQGLKRGEHVRRLAVLRILDVRLETLAAITADDVRAEGFGDLAPHDFVAFFCRTHRGVQPTSEVVRIAFAYVDDVEAAPAGNRPMSRRRTRPRCQDCQAPCSRHAVRCRRCAAKAATRLRGHRLLARPSRDEDYRPTDADLARVERQLRRLEQLRRYHRRALTVEETWAQRTVPVDQAYTVVAGVTR